MEMAGSIIKRVMIPVEEEQLDRVSLFIFVRVKREYAM